MAGLVLDPWEERVLANALNLGDDDKWAALEVGLVVPRQNGKGSVLEARELAALFLVDEPLTIHSAHQFDTSLEAFRRLLFLIEDTPDLDRLVKRVSKSHGEEGIELKNGQRIRFRTRTAGGGRGFSCDLLILDEAMYLPETAHGALLPTLSARRGKSPYGPQVWYTGSAVDQNVHEHGIVLTRVRERGMKGDDPGLQYMEWSADGDLGDIDEFADSLEAWAQANPGLGIRITAEHIGIEQRSMDPRTFAVERLGVGDWPNLAALDGERITLDMWISCEETESQIVSDWRFAYDIRPDRKKSAIAVAGFREDGRRHVEVVEHKSGTKWLAPRLRELVDKYDTGPVIMDQNSPAAAIIAELQEHEVPFDGINAQEHARACGMFYDAVDQQDIVHIGQSELAAALRGAKRRPLGDSWAWSRKNSTIDICPLVASTLAIFGLGTETAGTGPMVAWAD
jgi:hypothetical protein